MTHGKSKLWNMPIFKMAAKIGCNSTATIFVVMGQILLGIMIEDRSHSYNTIEIICFLSIQNGHQNGRQHSKMSNTVGYHARGQKGHFTAKVVVVMCQILLDIML